MRSMLRRLSDLIVVHPIVWSIGSGSLLVVLGLALDISPVVVVAAGTATALINIVHARKRGYCPVRPSRDGADANESIGRKAQ